MIVSDEHTTPVQLPETPEEMGKTPHQTEKIISVFSARAWDGLDLSFLHPYSSPWQHRRAVTSLVTGVDSGYGAAAVDTAMNLLSPQGFGKREGPGWTLVYLRYLSDGTHGGETL